MARNGGSDQVDIKYMNVRVDVMANNLMNDEDQPVHVAFDASWREVARCHSYRGSNATLVYDDTLPEGDVTQKRRVYLKVDGDIVLDPVPDPQGSGQQFAHKLIPSSSGIYANPPKPILDEDGNAYLSCKIEGAYAGVYDIKAVFEPLRIECDVFHGKRV